MKAIRESDNKQHWPCQRVKSVECRKRDLVIRVSDWLSDKDEPGYDVECYIGGIYDWNESKCFTLSSGTKLSALRAKSKACEFAQKQLKKLL